LPARGGSALGGKTGRGLRPLESSNLSPSVEILKIEVAAVLPARGGSALGGKTGRGLRPLESSNPSASAIFFR
jgi:hypothetical protein